MPKLSLNNSQIAYLASLLAGMILVVVLRGHVNSNVLFGWLAINILTVILRIWLDTRHTFPHDPKKDKKYHRFLQLTGITLSGIVWASSAWVLFPENDLVRQSFLIFVLMGLTAGAPAASAPSMLAFLCFTQPILHTLALRFIHEDTQVFYIMAVLTEIYNIALIITSLNFKKIDEHLRIAKEAAEAANLAKSEFLANISHEIRTPINAIVGINHLLKRTSTNPTQLDLIEKSLTASQTLLGNIENILDYSKVENQKITLETSTFELQTIVDTVETLIELDIKNKKLRFSSQISAHTARTVKGDPVKLIQILSNLLKNAVKFTDTGEVELSINELERTSSPTPKALIHFAVRDTGIGIHQKDHDKLFQSFTQVNTTHSRKYGGTGLGLSISQQLAKLMGSVIEFDSTPRQGSTFYFSLWLEIIKPDTLQIPDSPTPSISTHLRRLNGYSLLLIEDDPLNQLVAKELLTQSGLQVQVASNAQKAFVSLHQQLPDLILLDIQMPYIDGYEVISIIRKNVKWKDIPVICLTAHASTGEKEKALNAGMNDFITKPIDPQEIHKTLSRWLPEKNQTETANTAEIPAEKPAEQKNTHLKSQNEITNNIQSIIHLLKQEEPSLIFLKKTQATLQQSFNTLQQHLDTENWQEASKCAHQLRGTANFYASEKLQKCLQEIDEGSIRASNLQATKQLLEEESKLVQTLLQQEIEA